ncbi:uncharacterized protein LOC132707654, partial [Cylas formicarius]|uniref:uncharacterized protein LOC132707654 n=1 Tax=Cylas formicarius TaxID=197179 RepID=UPI0029588B61
ILYDTVTKTWGWVLELCEFCRKEQAVLEERARNGWKRKWGFYLEFDQICVEEARNAGLTGDEYKRRTRSQNKQAEETGGGDFGPACDRCPRTTAGFIGWRAKQKDALEKFGPLYVSPKATMRPMQSYSCIILG